MCKSLDKIEGGYFLNDMSDTIRKKVTLMV